MLSETLGIFPSSLPLQTPRVFFLIQGMRPWTLGMLPHVLDIFLQTRGALSLTLGMLPQTLDMLSHILDPLSQMPGKFFRNRVCFR